MDWYLLGDLKIEQQWEGVSSSENKFQKWGVQKCEDTMIILTKRKHYMKIQEVSDSVDKQRSLNVIACPVKEKF